MLYKTIFLILLTFCFVMTSTAIDYDEQRNRMVDYQIAIRGVNDYRVLSAMRTIPRHEFVPDDVKASAYDDRPLPIGYGQTISQPYIVALMTELLELSGYERVLEIGTGSGYQAAVLADIVDEVYTVEIYDELSERASTVFEELGYINIMTLSADGYYGWEEFAPYDAIIVTCAPSYVPPPLISQLKVGGLLVIPVGPPFSVQRLLLIRKETEQKIVTHVITDVVFVPLIREKK